MNKLILAAALSALGAAAMAAPQANPLWLRNTAISPDGQTIAFTYRGDIYTVPFAGGAATRITTDPAVDSRPVWSPDGRKIAFGSDRMGSTDIYIVDAAGGQPLRLTTHSGSEVPLAFADNGTVIFAGNIMPSPQAINGYVFNQLYTVPAAGGRPRLLLSLPSDALSVDAQGRILYTDKKGFEDKFRKHEQSSGTSDVWLVEGALKGNPVFRQLTRTPYHSVNPQWGRGDSFYYVSEADSTLNVYATTLSGGQPRQLTHFKGNPVRSLTVAPDGRIAFSQNGEIWTMASADSQPVRLDVRITADNPERSEQNVRRTSASNMAIAPSGKEVAVVVRGDIFVTPADYSTTRQVTATPGQERDVCFSPDGRFIVYDSERDGRWQLYKAEIGKDDPSFAYAATITETPWPPAPATPSSPSSAPTARRWHSCATAPSSACSTWPQAPSPPSCPASSPTPTSTATRATDGIPTASGSSSTATSAKEAGTTPTSPPSAPTASRSSTSPSPDTPTATPAGHPTAEASSTPPTATATVHTAPGARRRMSS